MTLGPRPLEGSQRFSVFQRLPSTVIQRSVYLQLSDCFYRTVLWGWEKNKLYSWGINYLCLGQALFSPNWPSLSGKHRAMEIGPHPQSLPHLRSPPGSPPLGGRTNTSEAALGALSLTRSRFPTPSLCPLSPGKDHAQTHTPTLSLTH